VVKEEEQSSAEWKIGGLVPFFLIPKVKMFFGKTLYSTMLPMQSLVCLTTINYCKGQKPAKKCCMSVSECKTALSDQKKD